MKDFYILNGLGKGTKILIDYWCLFQSVLAFCLLVDISSPVGKFYSESFDAWADSVILCTRDSLSDYK
jgi:hypothetical protein